jgi:hypothetical protein
MTVTAEATTSMLEGLMDIAKNLRGAQKYSEDEKFTVICIIVHKDDFAIVVTPWKDDTEKRRMMKQVSDLAREGSADLVGVVSDTRWTTAKLLSNYYKVPEPTTDEEFKLFQTWYHALLRKNGGEIKNLPREVWLESVMVAAKGPHIPPTALFAPYIEGPDDTVLYTAKTNRNSPNGDTNLQMSLGLIPDWWTQ